MIAARPGRRVLLLGGTAEARALAGLLAAEPGLAVTSSLAGRVRDPALPVGEVRIGGFGGVAGLAAALADYDALIDATHPFAATISAHAIAACARTGTPLLVLRRPPYPPDPAWRRVADVAAAAAAIRRPGTVLLTTGRRDLAPFAADATRTYIVRTVDPPAPPLPPHTVVVTSRGPYRLAGELALLRTHRVQTLVTKDSGGALTAAKLVAARQLGVDTIVVDRPSLAPGSPAPVSDVAAAHRWAAAL